MKNKRELIALLLDILLTVISGIIVFLVITYSKSDILKLIVVFASIPLIIIGSVLIDKLVAKIYPKNNNNTSENDINKQKRKKRLMVLCIIVFAGAFIAGLIYTLYIIF